MTRTPIFEPPFAPFNAYKSFDRSGADLAHAVKGYNSTVSVPTNPPKIRDRPKFNTTGYIDDFTSQDILDLIVFYNNNLGIVYEDDERIRREKLLAFLTRHQSSTCAG
ncbi:hypothetical protein C0991_009538 [Blastosporella zonata]|nr:hypothetical protein C0991_009538 [Blastosporella zonata]